MSDAGTVELRGGDIVTRSVVGGREVAGPGASDANDGPRQTTVSPCVESAIHLLQEKWVLLIVGTLLDGPRGFNDLGRDVGGCNPTTLAQRLSRLEDVGIVCKKGHEQASRSVYCLTPTGKELEGVVGEIRAWALRNLGEPVAPA